MRTDIKHTKLKEKTFNGIYRGVIEDNKDPEKLGRCRIRVWGIHDEDKTKKGKEGIPTEELHWAEPALGLIEGSVSGHGLFSIPLQGSHVFLFFEGGNWSAPRYFATAPGLPVDAPDTTLGFNDPAGEYPREDRLEESDYHRLARNENIEETIVQFKNDNIDKGVETATGDTWDEPESAYSAEYPNNIVLSTHSGITVEIDSTVGEERVHIFHPSNTYIEVDKDGNLVFRNDKDRFEITRGTRNTHVLESDNETVDGDRTLNVKGDEHVKVASNQNINIGNSCTKDIGKDIDENVAGNSRESIGGNKKIDCGGTSRQNIGGDWKVDVGGNIDITAGGNITIKGANVTIIP